MGGVTADTLAPQDNINRASTVTILDRAISTYADEAGATVKADGKGLVLVVAENVKITNAPEGTKIVVADGATGLTVNGKSVSDDQTYIVPKTEPAKPSGSSSGGYSHSHSWVDNYCAGCNQFKDTVVAAIGTKGYETLAAAVAAAHDGDTVKLVKDITLAQRVEASFNGTIDLNGRTLTSTETCKNGSVFHVASGTLTIKNGSMIGVSGPTGWTDELYKKECDAITVANGATVTLEDLSISICSRTGACVYVFDGGKAYITSGTYINDTTEFDANGTTKAMLLNQADNKPQAIFVSGGTFKGENPANGDNSHNPSTFLAAGYKAEGADNIWTVSEDTSKTYCAQVGNGKYETLAAALAAAKSGDTVKLVGNTELDADVSISNKITLDLDDKTIETKGNTISIAATGDLTVTGNGIVNNNTEATVETVNGTEVKVRYTMFAVDAGGKLDIESGTFKTKASQIVYTEGTTIIAGGTFENTAGDVNNGLGSSSMLCAKGASAMLTMDGGSIVATAESQDDGIYGIYGANGAKITLNDSVSIHTSLAAIGMNNTTSNPEVVVTINGGEYKTTNANLGTSYPQFNTVVYLPGKCHVTINGGTFTAENENTHIFSVPYVNVGVNLSISNGTFDGKTDVFFTGTRALSGQDEANTISITGGTFSSDPTAYVAEGYVAMKNDNGTWTVIAPTAIENGVTIKGIAGYEHRAFATVEDAYKEISHKVAALGGLGQETCSKEEFVALYTDDAKITWTIYGKQALVAGSEGKDAHTFTFGRAASYYRNDCNIAAIIVKGGNDSAALDLSATGGTFALPYNWWGEDIKNCEVSFTGITFDGVKSIPSTWASQAQSTPYTFDRCIFNGSVYGYHDYNINLTIQNSTFNAPENTDYAVTLQSTTGINGTVTLDHNTFNGYTRGVNFQRPGTIFLFTNNTITSTVSKPDRAAIQLTDGKQFVVTGNTVDVNAGNAFWFHDAATNSDVTYTISDNNIEAAYIGYSGVTIFDVNDKIISSDNNNFNNTDTTKCMKKGATVAEATNLTAIKSIK